MLRAVSSTGSGSGGATDASDVSFDDTGLSIVTGNNVQDALESVNTYLVDLEADEVAFDDTGLIWLQGSDVQEALENIDEHSWGWSSDLAMETPWIGSHFVNGNSVTPYTAAVSGGGSVSNNTTTTGGIGITTLSTSNSSATGGVILHVGTGAGLLLTQANQHLYIKGRVMLEDLATAGIDYVFASGISDSSTATYDPASANATVGIYYTNGVSNWQLFKRVSGVNTLVDSGVAVAADTWYEYEIHFALAAAGSVVVTLYINGSQVATTTGIQNSVASPFTQMRKKADATTARLAYLDEFYFHLSN